jgi:hypothetical protein
MTHYGGFFGLNEIPPITAENLQEIRPVSEFILNNFSPLTKMIIGTLLGASIGVIVASLKTFSSYSRDSPTIAKKRKLIERVQKKTAYAKLGAQIGNFIGIISSFFDLGSFTIWHIENTHSSQKITQIINEYSTYLLKIDENTPSTSSFLLKTFITTFKTNLLQLTSYYEKTLGFIANYSFEPIFNSLGFSHHSRVIFYTILTTGLITSGAIMIAKFIYEKISQSLDDTKTLHQILHESIQLIENHDLLSVTHNSGNINHIFIKLQSNLRRLTSTMREIQKSTQSIPINTQNNTLFDSPITNIYNIFYDCDILTKNAIKKLVENGLTQDEYNIIMTEITGKLMTADSMISLIEQSNVAIKNDMLKFNTYIAKNDPGIITSIKTKPITRKRKRIYKRKTIKM